MPIDEYNTLNDEDEYKVRVISKKDDGQARE